MNTLSIASDFAMAPGPRYREEGEHSGEQFRMEVLAPAVKEAIQKQSKLQIDLDGTFGYGTSFLEEAFGGLIRLNNYKLADLKRIITFKSDEEPELIEEIQSYMEDAERQEHSDG